MEAKLNTLQLILDRIGLKEIISDGVIWIGIWIVWKKFEKGAYKIDSSLIIYKIRMIETEDLIFFVEEEERGAVMRYV